MLIYGDYLNKYVINLIITIYSYRLYNYISHMLHVWNIYQHLK